MSFGFHTKASRSWGPYLYVERGGFMLHCGARRFGLPWHHGFGAWLTIRLPGRGYVVFKNWGCMSGATEGDA